MEVRRLTVRMARIQAETMVTVAAARDIPARESAAVEPAAALDRQEAPTAESLLP